MNSDLLARLMAATPEERSWLLTEAVLESLSPELRRAVWAVAVPHWFDEEILAALCPELVGRSEELYSELQGLSFVERFGERGHNIHEATRKMLLDKLWQDKPEEFRAISKLAADYFAKDETNPAEWLYHKAVVEPIGNALNGIMEPLDHNHRRSESEVILKTLYEQIEVNHVVDNLVVAETKYWSGAVHQRFYEPDQALENYQQAIGLYREVGERLGEAITLYGIGDVLQFKNRRDEALEHYQQAIGLYREVGDRLGEANTLQAIGDMLQFKNRRDEALENYQQAIGLFREVGDRGGEANSLQAIGDVLQFKKRSNEALENYQQAIGLFREVGDRLGEANTLQAIGDVLQFKKRSDEALENYQQAIGLFREVGSCLGEANTLQAIGDLQTDFNIAIENFFQPALDIYEKIGDRYSQGRILANSIALTYLKLGRLSDATESYKKALILWRTIQYVPGVKKCQRVLLILNPKLWKILFGVCVGFAIVLLLWKLKN
jgi:tetratricopeptide (TPR) repeat protein